MRKILVFSIVFLVCIAAPHAYAAVNFNPGDYTADELMEIMEVIREYFSEPHGGKVLYDDDLIYIELIDIQERWKGDITLDLYIENKSEDDIEVWFRDVLVNRSDAGFYNGSAIVLANSVYKSGLNHTFLLSVKNIKEYGIVGIETIDFTLWLKNESTREVFSETKVSLSVNIPIE